MRPLYRPASQRSILSRQRKLGVSHQPPDCMRCGRPCQQVALEFDIPCIEGRIERVSVCARCVKRYHIRLSPSGPGGSETAVEAAA